MFIFYKFIPYIASYAGPIQTGFLMCSCHGYVGTGIVIPVQTSDRNGKNRNPEDSYSYSSGSGGKNVIFQIASGPILSIPIHSNTCQYDPCKVLLKKMTLSLPMNLPKSVFFGSSDWASD